MITSVKRLAARRSARSEIEFKRDLIRAREAAELSQRRLADLLGVDHSTISRMERLDSDPKLSFLREYLTQCGAALDVNVVARKDIEKERRELADAHRAKVAKLKVTYVRDASDEDWPRSQVTSLSSCAR